MLKRITNASGLESHAHLYFECPYGKSLFSMLVHWMQLSNVPTQSGAWKRWFIHVASVNKAHAKFWVAKTTLRW